MIANSGFSNASNVNGSTFRANQQNQDRSVSVIHGINEGVFDFEGLSIEVVQNQLTDAFNLRSCDVALVNGEEVEWTFILCAGDRLEFIQRIGQKGLGDLLAPDVLMSRWDISEEEYRELKNLGLPTVYFHNGTIRHPEVAIDCWMAMIGKNHAVDEMTIKPHAWINSAVSIPPITHPFGPLIGNQEQLSSWLHPNKQSDPRYLKGRAVSGVIWVRKVHSRQYEVWLRSQQELDRALSKKANS